MLKNMEKVEIDENDSMHRRRVNDKKYLLLLIYWKLLVKMGHLGSGRSLELVR